VDDCTELGVPVISPVDEFNEIPLGKAGEAASTENVAELPLLVIVTLVIADP
jgi:hypothetical protein